ncbi:MAG: divalent metal cation transporter [Haloquadratum sp.]|nr:divalent metal cation transporter [Haloferacaceae archaeon]MDR9445257.1 divalent metal cation transporter [Haloquadratum sp.]
MQLGSGAVAARVRRGGPTWVAGAIAAGPATMAALVTAGATAGYGLLWVVLASALLGATTQWLSTHLGIVTEAGIVATVDARLGAHWGWVVVGVTVVAAGVAQLVIMKTLADISVTVVGGPTWVWALTWAGVLALGLGGGGYRVAEAAAKLLLAGVVGAFLLSVVVVPIDLAAALAGSRPRPPSDLAALVSIAGILGGAVHITLITMQTYTVRARGWTTGDRKLARWDTATAMLGGFGLYSVAIYLVAAAVLPAAGLTEVTAISASVALGPLVGPAAQSLFLLGLLGAAVTTLGGNTIVAPLLLADKLGWEASVTDTRYRAMVVGVALLSAAGAVIEGAVLPLLVIVLAFGLLGTPFIVAVVLVLGTDVELMGPQRMGVGAVAAGAVAMVVTGVSAAGFVWSRWVDGGAGAIDLLVLIMAVGMALSTAAIVARGLGWTGPTVVLQQG